MKKHISIAIFDWAGTTVDYGSMAPALCLIEAFRAHGVVLTREEVRGPMGIRKDEHVKAILADPNAIEKFITAQRRPPAPADADAIYARLDQMLSGVVADRAELIPGHLELV